MKKVTKIARPLLTSALLAATLLQAGCAFTAGFLQGVTNPQAPPAPPAPAKLMLFGGGSHGTYLGCLNCSQYSTDSVLNEYGPHGSRYSQESIFNRYGDFGSRYSDHSACNPYASDPPVIVDSDGNFYGRLTVNRNNSEIGTGREYMPWLAAVCSG